MTISLTEDLVLDLMILQEELQKLQRKNQYARHDSVFESAELNKEKDEIQEALDSINFILDKSSHFKNPVDINPNNPYLQDIYEKMGYYGGSLTVKVSGSFLDEFLTKL